MNCLPNSITPHYGALICFAESKLSFAHSASQAVLAFCTTNEPPRAERASFATFDLGEKENIAMF
jgi:hypothetical protein